MTDKRIQVAALLGAAVNLGAARPSLALPSHAGCVYACEVCPGEPEEPSSGEAPGRTRPSYRESRVCRVCDFCLAHGADGLKPDPDTGSACEACDEALAICVAGGLPDCGSAWVACVSECVGLGVAGQTPMTRPSTAAATDGGPSVQGARTAVRGPDAGTVKTAVPAFADRRLPGEAIDDAGSASQGPTPTVRGCSYHGSAGGSSLFGLGVLLVWRLLRRRLR